MNEGKKLNDGFLGLLSHSSQKTELQEKIFWNQVQNTNQYTVKDGLFSPLRSSENKIVHNFCILSMF